MHHAFASDTMTQSASNYKQQEARYLAGLFPKETLVRFPNTGSVPPHHLLLRLTQHTKIFKPKYHI